MPKRMPATVVQQPEATILPNEALAGSATISDLSPTAIASPEKDAATASGPLVDPFGPRARTTSEPVAELPAVPESVDTMRLSAIWTQRDQTYVLINGEIHQAGDEISRFRIESATQEGVWVAHWKGRDFLIVGSNLTLTTPGRLPHTEAPL